MSVGVTGSELAVVADGEAEGSVEREASLHVGQRRREIAVDEHPGACRGGEPRRPVAEGRHGGSLLRGVRPEGGVGEGATAGWRR